MSYSRRIPFLVVLLLSSVSLRAQTTVDPSGHWEGVIHVPSMDVIIGVDLAKNAGGQLVGTFNNPGENIHGFPLANVAIDGTSVTFAIKSTGGGAFQGNVSADGKSIKGTFTTRGPDGHPVDLPFDLARTGDAKIEAAPKSPAISKHLEGKWTGTLDVEGTPHPIGLSMLNQADGTATGFLTTREGLEIPITVIGEKGSSVTLDVRTVNGSYAGTLNADGSEIAGTWTEGRFAGPVVFRRPVATPAASATPAGPATTQGAENIANRWANAVGGRAKLASIRSIYREATVELGGMTGTIKAWHTADGKYRKEEQVATFSSIETFDGTNGTLQQGDAPPHAMAGPELERAKSTAFANANAMFFAFFPERRRGTLALEGDDTIVLKPDGGIDWRVTLDPATSLPKTMTHKQGERTITVTFDSYETVDGIKFEKEMHRATGDPRFDAVIRFTKTVINPTVDASFFSSEPKKTAAAIR